MATLNCSSMHNTASIRDLQAACRMQWQQCTSFQVHAPKRTKARHVHTQFVFLFVINLRPTHEFADA